MSNFWQRALFGALFVIVMVGAVLLGEKVFFCLLLLINILGLYEFYSLGAKANIQPQKFLGISASIFFFIFFDERFALFDISNWWFFKMMLLPVLYLIFFFELKKKSLNPFLNIGYTILGIIYITIPLFIFNLIGIVYIGGMIAPFEFAPQIILGYLFILWSSDTGAYLVGKKFGKHKLFERISPKKTWEGSIGGTALALIVAWIVSNYYHELSLINWLAVAVIIVITGTLGDLVESMFKRSINIKDSGNIIPGHGGILDRFDALLLSAPFVFFYLTIFR